MSKVSLSRAINYTRRRVADNADVVCTIRYFISRFASVPSEVARPVQRNNLHKSGGKQNQNDLSNRKPLAGRSFLYQVACVKYPLGSEVTPLSSDWAIPASAGRVSHVSFRLITLFSLREFVWVCVGNGCTCVCVCMSVCVCVCLCVCACVYLCVCVCVRARVYASICLCICLDAYCVRVYGCMYISVRAWWFISACVCVCVL